MNILGIETSSPVCSVGIADERGRSFERSMIDAHIHSEKLLTLIAEVLRQAEIGLKDLDAVAVSIGPGSFTGLRIGLSSAKGLCYSLGRKLIVVPTFDSVARTARDRFKDPKRITIAVDAKQGEFYIGSSDGERETESGMMMVRTKRLEEVDWSALAAAPALWITDRPKVIQRFGVPSELIQEYAPFCRGDVIARMGLQKYSRSEFADLPLAEPMYLKEFVVKSATI